MVKAYLADLRREWLALMLGFASLILTVVGAIFGNKAVLWSLAGFSLIFFWIAAYRAWRHAVLDPLISDVDFFVDRIGDLRFRYKDSEATRKPFSNISLLGSAQKEHDDLMALFTLVNQHIARVKHLNLRSDFLNSFETQDGREISANDAIRLLRQHRAMLANQRTRLF